MLDAASGSSSFTSGCTLMYECVQRSKGADQMSFKGKRAPAGSAVSGALVAAFGGAMHVELSISEQE